MHADARLREGVIAFNAGEGRAETGFNVCERITSKLLGAVNAHLDCVPAYELVGLLSI
jgi:hypothetical protein